MTDRADEAGPATGPAFVVPPAVPDGAALWLVRHGETEWSRAGRHTGRTNLPLTPVGEEQARALSGLLAGLRPSQVLCSPRLRALDTARLAGLHVDAVDDDLAEWDYGDYEGLTAAAVRERVPGWTLWTHGVPGGETAEQVGGRADRALTRAATHLADGPVVLVAHGHICRVMAARWIGLDARGGKGLLLGTAAPSILGMQYGTPAIERWNLPNPAATG